MKRKKVVSKKERLTNVKSNLQSAARSLFAGKLLLAAKNNARNIILDTTNIWPETRPKKIKAFSRHGKKTCCVCRPE